MRPLIVSLLPRFDYESLDCLVESAEMLMCSGSNIHKFLGTMIRRLSEGSTDLLLLNGTRMFPSVLSLLFFVKGLVASLVSGLLSRLQHK